MSVDGGGLSRISLLKVCMIFLLVGVDGGGLRTVFIIVDVDRGSLSIVFLPIGFAQGLSRTLEPFLKRR